MSMAITWKEQSFSYTELDQHICHYRSLFKNIPSIAETHHDFSKVVIFAENRPEWIFSLLGAMAAKRVAVTVDQMSPVAEVLYILNDCRPEWVVCSSKSESILREALSQLPPDYNPIIVNLDQQIFIPTQNDTDDLKKIMNEFHSKNDRESLIIYTSGTTGGPKGVILSYANLFTNLDAVCVGVPIFSKEKPVLALLPFHHVLPLVGTILAPLYVRATIVGCPTLDPTELMTTLQKNKVAILVGVPRLYTQIFRGIKNKIDQSSLAKSLFSLAKLIPSITIRRLIFSSVHKKMGGNIRFLVSGGAALDYEVARGLSILGLEVLEGYGMTETAPMITFPRPGKVRLGTGGQLLPGVEVQIVEGEIWVRGSNVMKGYYRKPQETVGTFENGWLKTGDLGEFDKDGYLRLTGRSKELIILSNGKNISPVEIELKLEHLCHEKKLPIRELAVVARNDLLHGLFVLDSLKVGDALEETYKKELYEILLAPYNENVPSYKQLRSFQFVHQALPRTRLEKLKRHELKNIIEKSSCANSTDDQVEIFEELAFIKDILEKETNSKINIHQSFAGEIALDSLSRVTIFAQIKESFNYEVNEETLKNYSTPFTLAQFLKEKATLSKRSEMDWKYLLSIPTELKLPRTWLTFRIFKNLSFIFFKTYFRFNKSGTENIPSHGPCLFVVNHQSLLDGLLVSICLKNNIMKDTYFYAKAKHVGSPFLRFLAATNNVIVVDTKMDLKLSIQKMAQALKMKKRIIIFPEGTRSHDGKLGELKKTFAILSKELQIPIVPVQISGAFEALPRGRILPNPFVKIQVSFKEIIWPKELSYEDIVSLTEEKLS